MICTGCGNECHETDKFCLRCGTFLSVQEGTYAAVPMFGAVASQPAAITGPGTAVSPALVPSGLDNPSSSYANEANPIKPTPYAGLMGLLLAAIVSFSIALFCLVLAWEMHAAGRYLLFAAQLSGASGVSLWFALKKRKEINLDPTSKGLRSLTLASICICIMFCSVAVGVGIQLGSKRAAFIALMNDWTHLQRVGQRISDKRNGVPAEIPAYLDMYKTISADVQDMQATTQKLLEEEQRYQTEYPEYSDTATKEMAHLRIAQQRATLLSQQIKIAEKMSIQNEQERLATWRNEMAPVLEQEDSLDHGN
jgi:hypothetical protein